MLFGTNEIEIIPQGSAEITFGINSSNTENPRIPERQRRVTTFDFDQRIQLNITGKIGDKIELGTQYNTESLFDFENQMNIGFQGEEDDILKNIEAGNISLPLQGTLITGSQSLFWLSLRLSGDVSTIRQSFLSRKVSAVISKLREEPKLRNSISVLTITRQIGTTSFHNISAISMTTPWKAFQFQTRA